MKKDLKDRKKKFKKLDGDAKELFSLKVTVMDNNDIKVDGPIDDPLLIMRIISGAMNAVVDHNFSVAKLNADAEKGRKAKEESRIILAK